MPRTSTMAVRIGALRRSAARACRATGVSLVVLLASVTPLLADGHIIPITWHAAPRYVPLFVFASESGGPMTLRQFRGRIVLLNVWATWCPTCRRELPTLDRLQEKLGSKDFEVVALSIDRDGTAAIAPFFREVGIRHLGIYFDRRGTILGTHGIAGIPTTLIIDRDGQEIARLSGPADWTAQEITAALRNLIAGQPHSAIRGQR